MPIENVRTGSADCACIKAAIVEESIPPERKTPSGTSATIRIFTAARSKVSSCSTASASVPRKGSLTLHSAACKRRGRCCAAPEHNCDGDTAPARPGSPPPGTQDAPEAPSIRTQTETYCPTSHNTEVSPPADPAPDREFARGDPK